MKSICILIVSLLLYPIGLLAQTHQTCGSTISPDQYKLSIEEYKKRNFINQNNNTCSIKLKPHIIRRSNGTGGLTLSELSASLAQLSSIYTPIGITFDFYEANFIDDDEIFDELIIFSQKELIMGNTYRDPKALNVFYAPNAAGRCTIITTECPGTFPVNWAYFPSSENEWVVMNNNFATQDLTLSHEVGHFFNLSHTNQGNSPERVVREGNNANCDSTGDLLCDTYASPTLSPNAPFSNVNENCQYTGTETDAIGEPYNSTNFGVSPQVNNIMITGFRDNSLECRTNFTTEQVNRMKMSIVNDYAHLSTNCDNNCSDVIVIDRSVLPGETDIQSARQTVIARNTIFNNATARYSAGTEITLSPNFDAVLGSNFDIEINNDCDNNSRRLNLTEIKQNSIQLERKNTNIFGFTIIPNPAIDKIEIKELKSGVLTIVDLKGSQMLYMEIDQKTVKSIIDISAFPKGFYIIKHLDNDGELITKKLIKE